MQELASGLWRWTAPHPAWNESADWSRDVGCVYYEAPKNVVLFDPQFPPRREAFLTELDRDVERVGPLAILLTVSAHARSSAELAGRYGARIGDPVEGVVGLSVPEVEETVYWLSEHRAVIVGESLVGDGTGGIALCPDTWVKGDDRERLRSSLHSLLELPVERVLVSHGEPVLEEGRAALAAALRA